MPYAQETGYTPSSFETIMAQIMADVNAQYGTNYTVDSFIGTNFYKAMYGLAQRLQENDVKTSEIFAKLQQYFIQVNAMISRPVVTNPGLVEKLWATGFVASLKPMIEADAGKIHVAVDVRPGVSSSGTITITNFGNLVSGTADTVTIGATVFTAQAGAATPGTATFQAASTNDLTAQSLANQINSHGTSKALVFAKAVGSVVTITAKTGGTAGNAIALGYTDNGSIGATKSGTTLTGGTANPDYAAAKLTINTVLKDSTAAGTVTQGTEVSNLVLSNGQAFDFKFNLPNRIPILLRLTITLSENNQVVVGAPEDTKAKLLANIVASYGLGRNFEPQRYFGTQDAPWAASIKLEWAEDDGSPTWSTAIYDANYNDLFEVSLANIELIEV